MRSLNSFWRLSLPLVVSAAMLVLVPVTGWAATTAPATTASATVTSSLAPARTAAAAVASAKAEVGVRYVFGGSSPSRGFDSSGLAQWSYAQHSVSVPRLVRQQAVFGTAVSPSSLLPGDLVFFDFDSDGAPDKTGVYIGSNQFVIAVDPGGVVVRSFAWPFYKAHYTGARRVVAAQAPAPAPTPAPVVTDGQRVVDKAKTYRGIPYKFGATGPNAYDCSGFVQMVYRQFNVRLPRTAAEQSRVGQAVAKNSLQPGDLVFFQNTYKNGVDHVGIYIGDNKFIDAWPGAGVTISDLTRPYFVSHYWGAKRVLP